MTSSAYFYLIDYESSTCNITNVTYPSTFPTEDTLHLWNTCDCGKHCQSRYPCINIYTDDSDETMAYQYSTKIQSCTITETSCPQGEDPLILNQELQETIALAETYINATVGCFKHTHEPNEHPIFLFLDFASSEKNFIIASALFGANILLFIVIYINYKIKECREKKRKSNQQLVGNPTYIA